MSTIKLQKAAEQCELLKTQHLLRVTLPFLHVAPAFLKQNAHILQVSDLGERTAESNTQMRRVRALLINAASLKLQKGSPGSHSASTTARLLNT